MKKEELISQNKELWATCFGDSAEFIDLYFSQPGIARNTIYKEQNGKLLAALQIVYYEVNIGGILFPAAYLSGIATHPRFRQLGLASTLIAEAHRRLHAEEVAVCFLIPANRDLAQFYTRHGQYIQLLNKVVLPLAPMSGAMPLGMVVETATEYTREMYDFYSKQRGDIMPTAKQLKTIVASWLLQSGRVLLAKSSEGIEAMAFVRVLPEGGSYVMDLKASGQDSADALLLWIRQRYGEEVNIRMFLPPDDDTPVEKTPYLMGRVVSRKAVEDIYGRCYASYFDADVPENNSGRQDSNVPNPGTYAFHLLGEDLKDIPPLLDE